MEAVLYVMACCGLAFGLWYVNQPKSVEEDVSWLFRHRERLHQAIYVGDLVRYKQRQVEFIRAHGVFLNRWQYDDAAMEFASARLNTLGTSLASMYSEARLDCFNTSQIAELKADIEQAAIARKAAFAERASKLHTASSSS